MEFVFQSRIDTKEVAGRAVKAIQPPKGSIVEDYDAPGRGVAATTLVMDPTNQKNFMALTCVHLGKPLFGSAFPLAKLSYVPRSTLFQTRPEISGRYRGPDTNIGKTRPFKGWPSKVAMKLIRNYRDSISQMLLTSPAGH